MVYIQWNMIEQRIGLNYDTDLVLWQLLMIFVYFYEPQKQYAKWKKSDTEKHGLYNFIYIKCKVKAHL